MDLVTVKILKECGLVSIFRPHPTDECSTVYIAIICNRNCMYYGGNTPSFPASAYFEKMSSAKNSWKTFIRDMENCCFSNITRTPRRSLKLKKRKSNNHKWRIKSANPMKTNESLTSSARLTRKLVTPKKSKNPATKMPFADNVSPSTSN